MRLRSQGADTHAPCPTPNLTPLPPHTQRANSLTFTLPCPALPFTLPYLLLILPCPALTSPPLPPFPPRVNTDDMSVEELTPAHYLAFKEKLVPPQPGEVLGAQGQQPAMQCMPMRCLPPAASLAAMRCTRHLLRVGFFKV